MASAKRTGSPTGTKGPSLPPWRISAGPDGQSVLTHGQPHASAWTRTPGRPSYREDDTRGAARDMKAKGLSTQPGRDTWSVRLSRLIKRSSGFRNRPSPRITKRAGRRAATRTKALMSVEKSFCLDDLNPPNLSGTAMKFVVDDGSAHQFLGEHERGNMRIGPLTLGYPVGPFDAAANPSHRTLAALVVGDDIHASAVMVRLQHVALG